MISFYYPNLDINCDSCIVIGPSHHWPLPLLVPFPAPLAPPRHRSLPRHRFLHRHWPLHHIRSVFIRDCSKCELMLSCQQFRTRDCKDLKVYLSCVSQPIIESSTSVQFGCYSFFYPQLKGLPSIYLFSCIIYVKMYFINLLFRRTHL